jgi:hypothetical protein
MCNGIMTSLRPILAILLLLTQAWAAQAEMAAVDAAANRAHFECTNGCCAAAGQGMQDCECRAEPARPGPAQAPLPEGRETLPQIARAEDVCADFLPEPAVAAGSRAAEVCGKKLHRQHVRMQALLCAFLN